MDPPAESYTAHEPGATHVEADLACTRCDYNLRTIAWSALCPECGTPVHDSEAPAAFRLAAQRDTRPIRRAISVWFVAILTAMIGFYAWFIVLRYFYAFPGLYTNRTYRLLFYGLDVSIALRVAAVWLILQPWRVWAERPWRWVRIAGTVLTLPALGRCGETLFGSVGLKFAYSWNIDRAIGELAVLSLWLGESLAWIRLMAWLRFRRKRFKFVAMLVGLAAILAISGSHCLTAWESLTDAGWFSRYYYSNSYTPADSFVWWQPFRFSPDLPNGVFETFGHVLILASLWSYFRALRRADRRYNRSNARTRSSATSSD